jgi:hypothetical protein
MQGPRTAKEKAMKKIVKGTRKNDRDLWRCMPYYG